MYYDKELWDKIAQATLYSIEPAVNPTYMPDIDAIKYSMDDYIRKTQEVSNIKAQINDIDKYMADQLSKTVYSYKVICTTIKHQNRTHHKYRTNKKWAKRYGYTYVEVQNEPIIFMNGTIYCTKDGLDQIKKICK